MAELKIFALNVNSICNFHRKNLLYDFMSKNETDILMLSETKLGNFNTFGLNGFNIFRNDRSAGAGGVAIIFRNNFKFKNIKKWNYPTEAISVDLLINNIWIRFISAYFNNISDIHNIRSIFEHNVPFIVGGDLNARNIITGDISSNQNGIFIQNTIDELNLIWNFPNKPTCYRSVHGSIIDHFILSNNFPIAFTATNIFDSFSDHFGIGMTLFSEKNILSKYKKILLYDKTNITKMNKFILNGLNNINISSNKNIGVDEIDQITSGIGEIFNDSIDKFVPTTIIQNQNVNLSKQTLAIKRNLKNLYRKIKRNNLHFDGHLEIIKNYKLLKICFINSYKTDVNTHFTKITQTIKKTNQVFSHVKRFTPYKKKTGLPEIMFTDENRNVSFNNKIDIVNEIARNFGSNHNLSINSESNMSSEVVNSINLLDQLPGNIFTFNESFPALISDYKQLNSINDKLSFEKRNILTCTEEIIESINSRKTKKSCGIDGMPSFIIKNFSYEIFQFFTILFNQLMSSCYFPNCWKIAKVTPIPKIGRDFSILGNCRPISNLNSISKIFEKIIQQKLMKFMSNLDIFENQFGFLHGFNTIQPLAILQNQINSNLNKTNFTNIVSLDLKSAFDTVWHDAVIHKMLALGINPYITRIIKSFLNNRKFFISNNNFNSELFNIPSGVPQGAIISPILFNIFIHDLPTDNNVHTLQYADDTLIYYSGKNVSLAQSYINIHLVKLCKFFKKWKLILNHNKTILCNVTGTGDLNQKTKRQLKNIKISVDGFLLKPQSNFKYLGIHFNQKNNFNNHIGAIIQKSNISYSGLKNILRSRIIEPKIKTNLYKIYIRPIFSYASCIWSIPGNISSAQMEKLRLRERKFLRSSSNFHRNRNDYMYQNNKKLYDTANINRIDRFLVDINIKFINKCAEHFSNRIKRIHSTFFDGKYKSISYLHRLNENNILLTDNKLLIYHTGSRNTNQLLYNQNQNTEKF